MCDRLPEETTIKIEKNEATRLWREQSQCIYPLIITNYLGTLWLETLGSKHPHYLLLRPESYAFRKDAMPFINELLDEGTPTSPESAAEKVNLIHDEPKSGGKATKSRSTRTILFSLCPRPKTGFPNGHIQ